MCGIVGSNFSTKEDIEKALLTIKMRGPDHTGIHEMNGIIFGSNRLAIQNNSSEFNQPMIENNRMIVYNGELWKGSFSGSNDTRYILDQIKNIGIEIVEKLDGMFALAEYSSDTNNVCLARDFIGEIPLYYYHNKKKFCFASEIKAIQSLDSTIKVKEIKAIEPGTYLCFSNITGDIIINKKYWSLPNLIINNTKEDITANIYNLLDNAVKKRIPDVPYAVLLSGGIDSSAIAYLLKQINPNIEAFTINLGGNGKKNRLNDLYWARLVADKLQIKLHEIIVSEEDINNTLQEAIYVAEDYSWTQISSAVPHILMAKEIKKHGYKVIFSGSGSDEIFASYSIERRWCYNTDQDYDAARRKLISNIHKNNIIRENKCLLSQGIECRTPFLDKDFIEYAINIPEKYRLIDNKTKPLLRSAFKNVFDENIINRVKVPEGEGVGIENIIKSQKDKIKNIYKGLFI